MAFLVDGAATLHPMAAKRRRPSRVNWLRLTALGVNLALWAVIVAAARHFAS